MTVYDLIVAAPWITFGAGLSAVCIRLLRSGRRSGPQPGRSPTPSSDPAGEETASRPYRQEARCCEKNT